MTDDFYAEVDFWARFGTPKESGGDSGLGDAASLAFAAWARTPRLQMSPVDAEEALCWLLNAFVALAMTSIRL